jgi:predicted DNA-binding transcriptional regulator AlpA
MSKSAAISEARRYLRKADVAARYGCTTRHVDRLAEDGKIPRPIYIAKFPMWSEAELAAFERAAVRRRAAS